MYENTCFQSTYIVKRHMTQIFVLSQTSNPIVGVLVNCRRVIHTVGPKYAVKYHTAAENALSHCYRSCLELLIDNGLHRWFNSHISLRLFVVPYVME